MNTFWGAMKSIDDLVQDIYALFEQPHECNEDNVRQFAESLANVVRSRLAEDRDNQAPTLRVSNIGKPDRQQWYDHNGGEREKLPPWARIKFLYGDIIEATMLFLAKEAGHQVDSEQVEVEINGVIGHNDAVIDGHVVDVKSASTYAFQKFKNGTLSEDDPFGYMDQLAGYSLGLGGLPGAFLAVDKTLGHVALMKVPLDELQALNIPDRIEHIRAVINSPEPPERCYETVPDGKSGNEKLAVGCNYCSHKFTCWADANDGLGLRTFIYADGPRHLTNVVKEPQVMEVTF